MAMKIDDSNMIKEMGSLNVPVRVPSNSFPGYVNDDMSFETFLKKHWQNSKSQTYLHQWQFALKNYEMHHKLRNLCCGARMRRWHSDTVSEGHVRLLRREQGQRRDVQSDAIHFRETIDGYTFAQR